jgi:hypothetical protein
MNTSDIAGALGLKRIGSRWPGACPIQGGKAFTLTEK